jgi:hypothetical protein
LRRSAISLLRQRKAWRRNVDRHPGVAERSPRNHFGSKSKRDTEVAAIFYSLLETAKLHGVNPARYLLEAARAERMGETLMPWDLTPDGE